MAETGHTMSAAKLAFAPPPVPRAPVSTWGQFPAAPACPPPPAPRGFVSWNDRASKYLPHLGMSTRAKGWLSNGIFLVALANAIPTFILAWQIFRSNESEGVFIPSFVIFSLFNIAWVIFGLVIETVQIVIASGLFFIGNILVIVAAQRSRSRAVEA